LRRASASSGSNPPSADGEDIRRRRISKEIPTVHAGSPARLLRNCHRYGPIKSIRIQSVAMRPSEIGSESYGHLFRRGSCS